MSLRRLRQYRMTPRGVARFTVEAFFDDEGRQVPREQATRFARAMYGEDERWLADEFGAIDEFAELDVDPAHWSGPITIEGELTGDDRIIEPGALRWDDLPLPFRMVFEDGSFGHEGAMVVGQITSLTRDGNAVVGEGVFDLGSEAGREALRLIGLGVKPGVSVDLDDVTMSIRVAEELIAEMDAEWEAMMEGEEPERPAPDADGRIEVARFEPGQEVMVTEDARVRGATSVDIPAFANARIGLTEAGQSEFDARFDDGGSARPNLAAAAIGDVAVGDEVSWTDDEGETQTGVIESIDDEAEEVTIEDGPTLPVAEVTVQSDDAEDDDAVVASAAAVQAPTAPPAAWFEAPDVDEPTPLTISDTGRVFGHLAAWGVCHIGFDNECVLAPKSQTGYAHFHTGALRTDDGSEVPVGHLTFATGHADTRLSARPAAAHYDDTGSVFADVRVGEDEHGIWFAGALRPGLTDEQVRTVRAAALSGDWRRIGGSLELVATLSVNVPGFPVPRFRVASAAPSGQPQDQVMALVAAGVVPPREYVEADPATLTASDLAWVRRAQRREAEARKAELRRKVHGDDATFVASLTDRVHGG